MSIPTYTGPSVATVTSTTVTRDFTLAEPAVVRDPIAFVEITAVVGSAVYVDAVLEHVTLTGRRTDRTRLEATVTWRARHLHLAPDFVHRLIRQVHPGTSR